MNYVKMLKTNVKGLNPKGRECELGPKTLLIGQNESGKSAIIEALSLATMGQVPSLFLRTGPTKKDSDLISLCPKKAESVFAQAELSDTTEIRWELFRGKKEGTTKRAVCSVTKDGVPAVMNRVAVAPLEELKAALRGSTDTSYKFFFEKLLSNRQISMNTIFLDCAPTRSPISLSEVKPYLPDLGKMDWTMQDNLHGSDLMGVLEDIQKRKRKASAESKVLSNMLRAYSTAESVTNEKLLPSWEDLFKSLRFEYLKKAYRQNEDRKLSDVTTYRYRNGFITAELRKLGSPESLKNFEGSAQVSERIEALLERRVSAMAARRLQKEQVELSAKVKNMDLIEKFLWHVIRKLTQSELDNLVTRASGFLPRGEEVGLSMSNTHLHVGLSREGTLYRAMSGSTESRVLAALAAALVPSNETAIVVLEDRMWDLETLGKTMRSLEKCPCQIIIMSTMRPRGRARKEWTYVEVQREVEEDASTVEEDAQQDSEACG